MSKPQEQPALTMLSDREQQAIAYITQTWRRGMHLSGKQRRDLASALRKLTAVVEKQAKVTEAGREALDALKASMCFSCGARMDDKCGCVVAITPRRVIAKVEAALSSPEAAAAARGDAPRG